MTAVGDVMAAVGDVMAAVGDVMATVGDVMAADGDVMATDRDVMAADRDVMAAVGDAMAAIGDVMTGRTLSCVGNRPLLQAPLLSLSLSLSLSLPLLQAPLPRALSLLGDRCIRGLEEGDFCSGASRKGTSALGGSALVSRRAPFEALLRLS